MDDRLEEFLRQATTARERAAGTEGEFKGQWLRVAEIWELLAREYGRRRTPRPQSNEQTSRRPAPSLNGKAQSGP